jgi:hypothetical protein
MVFLPENNNLDNDGGYDDDDQNNKNKNKNDNKRSFFIIDEAAVDVIISDSPLIDFNDENDEHTEGAILSLLSYRLDGNDDDEERGDRRRGRSAGGRHHHRSSLNAARSALRLIRRVASDKTYVGRAAMNFVEYVNLLNAKRVVAWHRGDNNKIKDNNNNNNNNVVAHAADAEKFEYVPDLEYLRRLKEIKASGGKRAFLDVLSELEKITGSAFKGPDYVPKLIKNMISGSISTNSTAAEMSVSSLHNFDSDGILISPSLTSSLPHNRKKIHHQKQNNYAHRVRAHIGPFAALDMGVKMFLTTMDPTSASATVAAPGTNMSGSVITHVTHVNEQKDHHHHHNSATTRKWSVQKYFDKLNALHVGDVVTLFYCRRGELVTEAMTKVVGKTPDSLTLLAEESKITIQIDTKLSAVPPLAFVGEAHPLLVATQQQQQQEEEEEQEEEKEEDRSAIPVGFVDIPQGSTWKEVASWATPPVDFLVSRAISAAAIATTASSSDNMRIKNKKKRMLRKLTTFSNPKEIVDILGWPEHITIHADDWYTMVNSITLPSSNVDKDNIAEMVVEKKDGEKGKKNDDDNKKGEDEDEDEDEDEEEEEVQSLIDSGIYHPHRRLLTNKKHNKKVLDTFDTSWSAVRQPDNGILFLMTRINNPRPLRPLRLLRRPHALDLTAAGEEGGEGEQKELIAPRKGVLKTFNTVGYDKHCDIAATTSHQVTKDKKSLKDQQQTPWSVLGRFSGSSSGNKDDEFAACRRMHFSRFAGLNNVRLTMQVDEGLASLIGARLPEFLELQGPTWDEIHDTRALHKSRRIIAEQQRARVAGRRDDDDDLDMFEIEQKRIMSFFLMLREEHARYENESTQKSRTSLASSLLAAEVNEMKGLRQQENHEKLVLHINDQKYYYAFRGNNNKLLMKTTPDAAEAAALPAGIVESEKKEEYVNLLRLLLKSKNVHNLQNVTFVFLVNNAVFANPWEIYASRMRRTIQVIKQKRRDNLLQWKGNAKSYDMHEGLLIDKVRQETMGVFCYRTLACYAALMALGRVQDAISFDDDDDDDDNDDDDEFGLVKAAQDIMKDLRLPVDLQAMTKAYVTFFQEFTKQSKRIPVDESVQLMAKHTKKQQQQQQHMEKEEDDEGGSKGEKEEEKYAHWQGFKPSFSRNEPVILDIENIVRENTILGSRQQRHNLRSREARKKYVFLQTAGVLGRRCCQTQGAHTKDFFKSSEGVSSAMRQQNAIASDIRSAWRFESKSVSVKRLLVRGRTRRQEQEEEKEKEKEEENNDESGLGEYYYSSSSYQADHDHDAPRSDLVIIVPASTVVDPVGQKQKQQKRLEEDEEDEEEGKAEKDDGTKLVRQFARDNPAYAQVVRDALAKPREMLSAARAYIHSVASTPQSSSSSSSSLEDLFLLGVRRSKHMLFHKRRFEIKRIKSMLQSASSRIIPQMLFEEDSGFPVAASESLQRVIRRFLKTGMPILLHKLLVHSSRIINKNNNQQQHRPPPRKNSINNSVTSTSNPTPVVKGLDNLSAPGIHEFAVLTGVLIASLKRVPKDIHRKHLLIDLVERVEFNAAVDLDALRRTLQAQYEENNENRLQQMDKLTDEQNRLLREFRKFRKVGSWEELSKLLGMDADKLVTNGDDDGDNSNSSRKNNDQVKVNNENDEDIHKLSRTAAAVVAAADKLVKGHDEEDLNFFQNNNNININNKNLNNLNNNNNNNNNNNRRGAEDFLEGSADTNAAREERIDKDAGGVIIAGGLGAVDREDEDDGFSNYYNNNNDDVNYD